MTSNALATSQRCIRLKLFAYCTINLRRDNLCMQMRLITMHNDLADSIDIVLEVFPGADDEVFTDEVFADLVESLSGHGLQRATHHWVVF